MHTLPPLPYPVTALEPVIEARALEIHHGKHHKSYVDGLNKAELALADARAQANYSYIRHWEDQLAFHGSGHLLHCIYWTNMTAPGRGGLPLFNTQRMANQYFGNIETMRAQFLAAAKDVQGSGWCILAYQPAFARLEILQCEKHQNLTQWGVIPILVCDVWEHAYYLQYQNNRADFVDLWWTLINWPDVERRLALARMGYMPLTED